jgi:AP-2 complex subunit beta-1
MDFVRKSVRAIGKLAIKIEPAAKLCINTLLELVATKISYIVQEATVVIRNIFRKYPNQYESIIGTLCENLDSLDEPEAKAAMVWVIGQYADRIENSDQLLEDFLFTFPEEPVEVQLQLLTASVKLFLHRPTKCADIMMKTLNMVVNDADNPDLRDRGYMYWRLIAHLPGNNIEVAKAIVLGDKPSITAESEKLEPATLEEMCLNIGTLVTIYLKPVQQVFRTARPRRLQDSPALQKQTLPSYQATLKDNEQRKSLAMLNTSIVSPQSFMSPNRGDSYSANGGNLAAAMDAADMYFSGMGNQQMAQMQLSDAPLSASPGPQTNQSNYFAAQQPQQHSNNHSNGNGDLLTF